jgi:hypothetical protein
LTQTTRTWPLDNGTRPTHKELGFARIFNPQQDKFGTISRELGLFLKDFSLTNKLGLYKEELDLSHQGFGPHNQTASTLVNSVSTNPDLLQR